MKHTIFATLALFSSIAFADVTADLKKVETDYNKCLQENLSNAGMKECTGVAYEGADVVLNRIYQNVVKGMKKPSGDSYSDKLNAESLRRLVAAQRAWIAYRNSNSDLYGTTMLGGTGESLEIMSKAYEMAQARAQELADLFGSY